MSISDRQRRRHASSRVGSCFILGLASLLLCGCFSQSHTARRWIDPLGFVPKKELSEQPEFVREVQRDNFPSASQLGLPRAPEE